MEFTYQWYGALLNMLTHNEYSITNYHDWTSLERCVILRHDIDYDPAKALQMAYLEHERGVCSTYFVLLTSGFYNVFSSRTKKELRRILELGHEIGLHFDEACYGNLGIESIREKILTECSFLSKAIETPVTTVSMHRPSKEVLEADLKIPGIINSYGNEYFKGFKYLSDSRRKWREPVEDIICTKKYSKLHILTHAFWYYENELDIHDSIAQFIGDANSRCYSIMQENITDLASIMKKEEVTNR